MKKWMLDETCTKAIPKALARHGHDWGTTGFAGVILGVHRCRACNVVATGEHFETHAESIRLDEQS